MEKKHILIRKTVYSAMCIALAYVLPMLIGNIPEIGRALAPMHIPVLLCGFICGWQYGAVVGFVSPLLKSLSGTPPFYPKGIGMAFELASYGFIAGLMYKLLPKKIGYIYVSLITAMIGGRIVWGIARFLLAGISGTSFPMSAFIAGAVTDAVPGIILHVAIVPLIVIALRKAGLVLNK